MADLEAEVSREEAHERLALETEVERYAMKPWSVEGGYDSATGLYEMSIPELNLTVPEPTREAAARELEDALRGWLRAMIETGETANIPEPRIPESQS